MGDVFYSSHWLAEKIKPWFYFEYNSWKGRGLHQPLKKNVSHLYSAFPDFSSYHRHFTITLNPLPQASTVSFLYEEEPPPLRSTPWGAYRTFGCHILVSQSTRWTYLECICSTNHHHPPGTHFTDPWRDGRLSQPAGSEMRYWLSYLGRLELSWPAYYVKLVGNPTRIRQWKSKIVKCFVKLRRV